jgi:C1A family cysteine protease
MGRPKRDQCEGGEMSKFIPQGMGWIPDLPDTRDFSVGHEAIQCLLRNLSPSPLTQVPDEVDLRFGDEGEIFLTEPHDQGHLQSSTAFAILSLVEYFERRVRARTFDGAALFLYKITRNLRNKQAKVSGDTGADLRTTCKALQQFGVPDEAYWPYELERFDVEPSPFEYQLAQRFKNLRYFRIDSPLDPTLDDWSDKCWDMITSFLAAGFPIAFGFSVPSSISRAPNIPCRPEFDDIRGGQAAIAIGYKRHHFGRGQHALLIRSSWGSPWGDNGYGWLPVSYLRRRVARDFWCLVSEDWLDSIELSRPSVVDAVK